MSRQSPLGALQFVLISSLLSFACSRPMTCALEGCNQDNGVVLSSDLNAGQSADAEAQQDKDNLGRKIKEIFDRLGATEALAALLQETVRLHETRIKTLEDHAQGTDGKMLEINAALEHHEEEIHSQGMALRALETSLNARIDAQAALDKAAIDQLRTDLGTTEASLMQSIQDLDQATQESIAGIIEQMKIERAKLEDADAAVAKAAQDNLLALETSLLSKISTVDSEIRTDLGKKITNLNSSLNSHIQSSKSQFLSLFLLHGVLQGQLFAVSVDNKIEQAKIRAEIKTVQNALTDEVANRSLEDQKLWAGIVELQDKQAATQAQLVELDASYTAYLAAHQTTHDLIDTHFADMTASIATLKSTLENQIATESERIDEIMDVLLPAVSNLISNIQAQSDGLVSSLAALETKVDGNNEAFLEFKSSHSALLTQFSQLATSNNASIATLNSMLANVKSCSVVVKTQNGPGNSGSQYAELTCGTTKVNLKINN